MDNMEGIKHPNKTYHKTETKPFRFDIFYKY